MEKKYIWIQNGLPKILVVIAGESRMDYLLRKLNSAQAYLVG
jgi:hypothetical protein